MMMMVMMMMMVVMMMVMLVIIMKILSLKDDGGNDNNDYNYNYAYPTHTMLPNHRYSIGADDDFQHHSYPSAYPSAPTDNEPYNPGYYDRQVGLSLKGFIYDL